MTYDAAGNVKTHNGHTYTFDEFNMLKSDQYGALTREFIYNASDQRIGVLTSTASGSWWRWTFRDPLSGKVLREFTSEGVDGRSNWKWQKDYIWRDSLLLATVQPNPNGSGTTTYHYHLDHLGTPRRITDNSDVIVGVHDYHAFGPEAVGGTEERSLSIMKYTGHERDVVDGQTDVLDYMMARYYSPRLGRFLSVDPGGMNPRRPQSWNRYSYSYNSPLTLLDPDGRDPKTALRLWTIGYLVRDRITRADLKIKTPVIGGGQLAKAAGKVGIGIKGIDHMALDLTETLDGRNVIDFSIQSKKAKGLGVKFKVEMDRTGLGLESFDELAVMWGPFEKSWLSKNPNKFKLGWVWGVFSQDLVDVNLDLLLPYLFELSMMNDDELLDEFIERLKREEEERKKREKDEPTK